MARNISGARTRAPGTAISYYLPINTEAEVNLTITDMAGQTGADPHGPRSARHQPGPVEPERGCAAPAEGAAQGGGGQGGGGQRQGPAVDPGTYLVTLEVGGMEMTRSIVVLEDIWMGQR